MSRIIDKIGLPATMEQLAEECTELAQAALKYARYLRGENPTPKSFSEIAADFHEELADIFVVTDELYRYGTINNAVLERNRKEKSKRWKDRVEERLN